MNPMISLLTPMANLCVRNAKRKRRIYSPTKSVNWPRTFLASNSITANLNNMATKKILRKIMKKIWMMSLMKNRLLGKEGSTQIFLSASIALLAF